MAALFFLYEAHWILDSETFINVESIILIKRLNRRGVLGRYFLPSPKEGVLLFRDSKTAQKVSTAMSLLRVRLA